MLSNLSTQHVASTAHFKNFEAIRLYAAMFVIATHTGFERFFGWMDFLMDIFFMMSAFLIVRSMFSIQTAGGGFRRFFWFRFLRLAPVFFLTLTLYEAGSLATCFGLFKPLGFLGSQCALLGDTYPYWLFIQNIDLMVLGTDIFPRPWGLNHFWSLVLEEHFYMLAGILFFIGGLKGVGKLSPNHLLIALIAYSCVRLIHPFHYWTIAGRLDAFVIGALCGLYVYPNKSSDNPLSFQNEKILNLAFYSSIIVTSIYAFLYVKNPATVFDTIFFKYFQAFRPLASSIIVFQLLRTLTAMECSGIPLIPQRLNCAYPAICTLGAASYEIYVIHFPVASFLGRLNIVDAGWPLFALVLAITLPTAILAYKYVSLPVLRLRGKHLKTYSRSRSPLRDMFNR